MCGIYGCIGSADGRYSLESMGRALRHRGPDDDGVFIDGSAALGHRRLSIIDIAGGHQPMTAADGGSVIVFNGEIYNYREIRQELLTCGVAFNTASDTEVILNAYRVWGVHCLSRFNGQFAFALWDRRSRRLWLARDRLGKKPLYWMRCGGAFWFASEAKALWQAPGFSGRHDLRAVDQYLMFRYVPGERTLFEGISKVPPATWFLVDEAGDIVCRESWWSPPVERDVATGRPLESYAEEFQSIFSAAVRMRLVADVPLGGFLSAGIDSVSVASEMARSAPPVLFTIGLGGPLDETAPAARVARELGAAHHVYTVSADDAAVFPDAVAAMDEPYGDAIILPTYLLAREASRKVKVVLSGDGADEVMGGYIHQTAFRRYPSLPGPLGRLLSAAVRMVPLPLLDRGFAYAAGMGQEGRARLAALLAAYPQGLPSYLSFASLFTEKDRARLWNPAARAALTGDAGDDAGAMARHFASQDGLFDRTLQWDLRHWFPEQTLMKFDRLCMAHSIEGRCPYADHRLVEFFLKLPLDIYSRLCDNKRVVRNLYQRGRTYLPAKKKPFFLPLHEGVGRSLRPLLDEALAPETLRRTGWFNVSEIGLIRRRRDLSPLLADKKLMALAVLSLWLRAAARKGI